MAEVLSKDEQDVLESLRKLNRTMGEDEYHMISSTLDSAGMGLGFEYELNYWEKVDERFRSRFGAVPYSSRLHEIIEGLVEKGQVARNPDNPIEITYVEV